MPVAAFQPQLVELDCVYHVEELLASLSGCNTVHGFGEDIQHLGGAISKAG